MIYPKNFEQKIGFDQIRNLLNNYCVGEIGKGFAQKIKFTNNFSQIQKLLSQTNECKQIFSDHGGLPITEYFDVSETLQHISIEGYFVQVEDIFNLKNNLCIVNDCILFFKQPKEILFPLLTEIAENTPYEKIILEQINKIVDDKGEIRDSASETLRDIRKQIQQRRIQIEKELRKILSHAKSEGWVEDNTEMTVRNGRMVIPVVAANKRSIKGFVHDESATGQTVFIEPAVVFDSNNEIKELQIAEKREIIRILTELTKFLAPYQYNLTECMRYLGMMDFISAKAKLAILLEATMPLIEDKPLVNWTTAKHPLLWLSHKEQNKSVIPLDIYLDEFERILIISGPNAGGKSVCLKTLGLTQYMMQCGLLVSMSEFSKMGIFENIFIDIGDEQSLENDLSTYSSHLHNMKHFLGNCNRSTLLLIDEFGAGTEPQMGGALAESMLEVFNNNKSFGIITTHYSNLKLMADKHKGIVNGAMLYDSDNMLPLFKLKIGKPGSSFAFEIATQIGISKNILDSAAKKIGTGAIKYDKQLQDLETDKMFIDKKQEELKVADDFLSEMIDKYQRLKDDLEENKKIIINKAKEDAKNIILQANKLVENSIQEIRETQADKEKTKEIRNKLNESLNSLDVDEELLLKAANGKKQKLIKKNKIVAINTEIDLSPIQIGDFVRLIGQTAIGEVIELNGKNVDVSYGGLKVKVSLSKLEKLSKTQVKRELKTSETSTESSKYSIDYNEKISNFTTTLDIRGKRADEARDMLVQYIDEAILLCIHEVQILHGKGNGILRSIVRDTLLAIPEVRSVKDQRIEFGGHGISVVEIA